MERRLACPEQRRREAPRAVTTAIPNKKRGRHPRPRFLFNCRHAGPSEHRTDNPYVCHYLLVDEIGDRAYNSFRPRRAILTTQLMRKRCPSEKTAGVTFTTFREWLMCDWHATCIIRLDNRSSQIFPAVVSIFSAPLAQSSPTTTDRSDRATARPVRHRPRYQLPQK